MQAEKTPKIVRVPSPAESDAAFFDHQSGEFFRRIDWGAFWTAFGASLLAYIMTLAPTVTLEDSGELAVAPDYLGVPHPPGYPIWTLLTWFFQWVFGWVRYYGHPNPAWSVGLASAVFGALACGVLALMVSRSGADMLRGLRRANEVLGYATESLICWAGGVAGGLLLAFSPVMWSQAVIVEVYSLNALFQMLVMLFLYRWMSRPREDVSLYALAFLFGLGLTNHQTLMFLGLALAVGVFFKDIKLFRDFAIVGAALMILLYLNIWAKNNNHPEMMWLSGPDHKAFWIYSILFIAIPLCGLVLPRGRTVCITFLLVEMGISFYLFMPVASDQNPPINWGYPRTWEGFIHAISRGQYEKITLTDVFSAKFIAQIGSYLADLRSQFTLPIVLAGFLPFCLWNFRLGGRRINMFLLALLLTLSATALIMAQSFLAPAGGLVHAGLELLFRLLILGTMLIAGLGVLILVVTFLRSLLQSLRQFDFLTVLVTVMVLIGLAGALLYADVMILKAVFHSGATALVKLFSVILVLIPPLAGVAVYLLMKPPLALAFGTSEPLQRWLVACLTAFVSLGVIFIAFQNPSLDIQTMFIGRVQFIQSHAVYALWLGYGLIFTLTHLELLLAGRRVVRWAAPALAVALPLVLVYQNFFDEEQVAMMGGAEQNGHDFGWQFGHWQLRGVNGIRADLAAQLGGEDSEAFRKEWAAYPNPAYPPEMTTNAIYFGGTDPGRFVPTYMIYCARVRPDVYLITQNALADNTYMSVMRDLYGDTIWIPSQQNSNYAFQKYVEDVQSGRIPAGAEVDYKDGRVSVQGVAGVMMINGILAEMIFNANKYTNDFYVEESYVIPWMYPYLTPHGLIMKINTQPVPALTPEMVKNDRDFWDWYCLRVIGEKKTVPLTETFPPGTRVRVLSVDKEKGTQTVRVGGNWRFEHDVVARKTFSKLRSAIAGLYAYRRMFEEAEYAFKQSVDLYPLSPEANFRLADIYMQMRRYTDAKNLIREFVRNDPKNDKVGGYLGQVEQTEAVDQRRRELEDAFNKSGSGDINAALELADIYRRMGMDQNFVGLTMSVLNDTNLPPNYCLMVARMYAESQKVELFAMALQRYLERDQGNFSVWADYAAALAMMQKTNESFAALRRAVDLGGEPVREFARKDPRFNSLRAHPDFNRLVPPARQRLPLMNLPNLPGL